MDQYDRGTGAGEITDITDYASDDGPQSTAGSSANETNEDN